MSTTLAALLSEHSIAISEPLLPLQSLRQLREIDRDQSAASRRE